MTSSEHTSPALVSPQAEQRMGEAIYGPGYTGPATAEAKADPYAPTTWGNYDEELTVSSGQKCRVRKLDFQDVLEAGMLDKLNTLQGVVDKQVKKGEGQPPVDPMKLLKDKRTGAQFSELIDNVTVMCVTQPKLEHAPANVKDRKPGVVYVDTVGLVDKMEIFEHSLGELNKLATFRGGSNESPERVADVQGDGNAS